MTNDYYVNLANYYTNQLTPTSKNETINIMDSFENTPIDSYLSDYATSVGASSYSIKKVLTYEKSSKMLIIGIAQNGVNYNQFILILNEDRSINTLLTSYSGGTPFNHFDYADIDEDGNLYVVDVNDRTYIEFTLSGVTYGYYINQYRLVLMGNVFNTLKATFRKSYTLPNYDPSVAGYISVQKVSKKANSGEYLFLLNYASTSNFIREDFIHLQIYVGTSSEFTTYEGSTGFNTSVSVQDMSITWGETITALACISDYANMYFYKLENGTTSYVQNGISTYDGIFYDSNTVFALDRNPYLTTTYLYKIDLSTPTPTNTLVATVTDNYYSIDSGNDSKAGITLENGLVYIYRYYDTAQDTYKFSIDVYGIKENKILGSASSPTFSGTSSATLFSVSDSKYAYRNFTVFNQYKWFTIVFPFDANGYTGDPYVDTNLFIPSRMDLYDDLLTTFLFSRGLYDLHVYENITEATFNVPYTMLNNDTIGQAKLYGETGYVLTDNYINITKNIYENLMINFFNSIVVKDYTGRIYNDGGSRVNDSISKTNDMNSASVNKIKLFYNDGTDYTYLLPTPTITGSGNPMLITYEIPLVVDSDGYVLKYQILSNDENTLYFEHNTSSLNAGTYKITQECKIK